MRLVEAVAREFDQEAPVTRRVLARVPLARADWQPHPKSMTLGRLAAWLANAPGWTAGISGKDGFAIESFSPFATPATTDALLDAFDAGCAAARGAMATLDDAAALGDWSFLAQGKPMRTLPRIAMLRLFLLSDAIHHRGQMSVYLRLLDVPVPSIYGPSADEGPA
jgi:uncharacterized damage-inducible protein DinB